MKKSTAIVLVLTLVFSLSIMFSGCKEEKAPAPDTTTHTLPPTQATIAEPEWAEVNCDIALFETATNTPVILNEDFDTFALVGTNDADSYIVLKVTEEALNTIKANQALSDLQLIINGDTVADIVIDPATFTGEIKFGENHPYDSLCILASQIRGLY